MTLIDISIIQRNSGNDDKIALQLLDMGLTRISESIEEINNTYNNNDWELLCRCVHKLRPMLNFCGITGITDQLLEIEKNIKEQQEPFVEKGEIDDILDYLSKAREEAENLIKSGNLG